LVFPADTPPSSFSFDGGNPPAVKRLFFVRTIHSPDPSFARTSFPSLIFGSVFPDGEVGRALRQDYDIHHQQCPVFFSFLSFFPLLVFSPSGLFLLHPLLFFFFASSPPYRGQPALWAALRSCRPGFPPPLAPLRPLLLFDRFNLSSRLTR